MNTNYFNKITDRMTRAFNNRDRVKKKRRKKYWHKQGERYFRMGWI